MAVHGSGPSHVVSLKTAAGSTKYKVDVPANEGVEYPRVLHLPSDHGAEGTVYPDRWVWVQYQNEDDKVDHNLALVVAIVQNPRASSRIILSWGKEVQGTSGSAKPPRHVVCTDDFWVVGMESIACAVVENEVNGRVTTQNSRRESFSLDRHTILLLATMRPLALESLSLHAMPKLARLSRKRKKCATSITNPPKSAISQTPSRLRAAPNMVVTSATSETDSPTPASPQTPPTTRTAISAATPSPEGRSPRMCEDSCQLFVQARGWPAHLLATIEETINNAIVIADASSDATLRAWTYNYTLARVATDLTGYPQAKEEAHADVLWMSSKAFDARQASGETFRKPVIIREDFADAGEYTLASYGEQLKQCIGNRAIQIQGENGPETAEVCKFLEQVKGGKPQNALSLPDHARAIEPKLTRGKRFRILSSLAARANADYQGSTAKQIYYNDIESSQKFNILGGRGAFSGAHVDALDGTYVRALFGTKLWFIVPTELMEPEDWDRLGKDGAAWDPGDKARAIPLGPDDVLLLPPGCLVPHAVLTTSPSLMSGGMIWDERSLPAILTNLLWIGTHQKATNEAIPYQMAVILDQLAKLIKDDEGFSPDNRAEITLGIKQLRLLGCSCQKRCYSSCVCRIQQRRCTPLCQGHLSMKYCMHEKLDSD